jgi:hypothetical protein
MILILIYYLLIIIVVIFILIIINSYVSNKELFSDMRRNNHTVTTWTPYAMDCYNQPCYSNYFYKNGYMYPVF